MGNIRQVGELPCAYLPLFPKFLKIFAKIFEILVCFGIHCVERSILLIKKMYPYLGTVEKSYYLYNVNYNFSDLYTLLRCLIVHK